MKKIYLLAAMALTMTGCSSNDEDNQPTDALLAGTEWEKIYYYAAGGSNVPTENANDDFKTFFPEIQCTTEVSSTEENDTIEETTHRRQYATLTFSQKECQYYEVSGYTTFTYRTIRHYTQTTTYAEQEYTSSVYPYLSVKVTKDAIIIYKTVYGYQSGYTYLILNDFQSTKTWDEIISTDTETVLDIEEETFSYQRNDNEVILTNSNKKWVGTLDTDAWTLSVVQIVPEEKEIATFSLK